MRRAIYHSLCCYSCGCCGCCERFYVLAPLLLLLLSVSRLLRVLLLLPPPPPLLLLLSVVNLKVGLPEAQIIVGCGKWRVYYLVAGVNAQTRLLMTSKTQSKIYILRGLTQVTVK